MQNKSIRYLHLDADSALPVLDGMQAFKTVVVVEADVLQTMQWDVSRWLVESGCLYVLSWGKDCAELEESVEEASLEAANYEDVPEEQMVMTTSHEDEELSEAFWFAKHRATHPAHELKDTLILHIADEPRREELEALYREA